MPKETKKTGKVSPPANRSKYNVGKDERDIAERTYDGIIFDSTMEMKYYRDVVLPLYESGDIKYYELQKRYILQPGYKHNGKTILPVIYKADFYIEYADGHVEVIDTKGCADAVATLKRKMFWFQNPDVEFKWITYAKKYGGWVDWDYVAQERRAVKREREKKKRELEEMNNEQN